MIRFRNLTIENFLSYKTKTVVPLDNQGIVCIEGRNEDDPGAISNMAGKSTIMEALLWVLFGKTLRGVKHNAVINRKAKRGCKVVVSFTVEGVRYACARYRKHRVHANRTRIFREAKELNFRHEEDSQFKLESILGFDFRAFVNGSVFGGFDGNRKQFALLTDGDQKEILDSFLRFEKFELAQERTRAILKKSRLRLGELQILIAEAKGRVTLYKEKEETLLTSAKIFKDRERKERKKLKRELVAIVIPDPKKYFKELKRTEEQVATFSTKLDRAKVLEDAASRSLNRLRQLIKNRKSLLNKECPNCGQIVTEGSVKKFLKHLNNEIVATKKAAEDASLSVAKYRRKVTYGSVVLKDLNKKDRKQRANYSIRMSARTDLRKRLHHNGNILDPFFVKIEEAKAEYGRALSTLLKLHQKELRIQTEIKDLTFWDQGFGSKGVKTLVMREVLPAMNQKLKEYAVQVFQLPVELEFRPSKVTKKGNERELFHLHYQSKFNSTSYLGESSGGRRRIDICVLLVFSWLARSSNLLLVDEILDGLDDPGRESVLDILSKQRGTIFAISHARELKTKIGTVWLVRKKNGVSTLEIPS